MESKDLLDSHDFLNYRRLNDMFSTVYNLFYHISGIEVYHNIPAGKRRRRSANKVLYTIDSSSTPRVNSIANRKDAYSIFDTIELHGEGFSATPSENNVRFNDFVCAVITSSFQVITCKMDANQSIEMHIYHELSFSVHGLGNGLVNIQSEIDKSVLFVPSIDAVSPLSGSFYGGAVLELTGAGLDLSTVVIRVGDTNCELVESNFTLRKCKVPAMANPNDENSIQVNLTICHTKDAFGECPYENVGFKYDYRKSESLSVTAVQPPEISQSGAELSVVISGFSGGIITDLKDVQLHHNDQIVTCVIDVDKSDITSNPGTIVCLVNGTVSAGTYDVFVIHKQYGNAKSTSSVVSKKVLSAVTPSAGSLHGGLKVRIDGNGFPKTLSALSITIGNGECKIVGEYGSNGEVYCITPANSAGSADVKISVDEQDADFPALSFVYEETKTPKVNSVAPQNGKLGDTIVLTGENFSGGTITIDVGGKDCPVTGVTSSTTVSCIVPELPSGTLNIIVTREDLGISNANIAFVNSLLVDSVTSLESGFGGGKVITIAGKGFGSDTEIKICNSQCLLGTSDYSAIECIVPTYDAYTAGIGSHQCDLKLTNNDQSIVHTSKFVYKESLTPSITDVTPHRSGTGGGVTLTITGTDFSSDSNTVRVVIDDVPCVVSTASMTQIVCVTGKTNKTNMEASVVVTIDGKGDAIPEQGKDAFEYIDVWSSPHSWGGNSPPEEGKWNFDTVLFFK